MRLCAFALLLGFPGLTLHAAQAGSGGDLFAPLHLYNGSWQVSAANRAAGAKPDLLVNQCAELGKFYACGQMVNGQSGGLVVFVPKGAPGHYATQTISASGRASGIVDLDVNGDTWTYLSRRDEYGKTTFYRTLNVFGGKNKIHFESAHSSDQKQWTTDGSGDEVRTGTR